MSGSSYSSNFRDVSSETTSSLTYTYDDYFQGNYTYLKTTAVTHTHSYTSSVTTAATCTTDGVMTYTCTCGNSYTESIPATGHDYEAVVTAPTCTEKGYTTYTCKNCGESYTADETEATGHSYYVISWNWEADYSGATVIIGCNNCDYYDTEGIYSQYITTSTESATCTEDGEIVYTAVKYWLITLTDTQKVVIPATGHDYEAVVTEPTCTEGGYTTYTCSVCGETYTADETEATGHSYTVVWSWDGGLASATFTCSNCNETQTVDATVTSRNVLGVVTRYATVEFNGETYTSDPVTSGTSLLIIGALTQTGSEESDSEETDSEVVEITVPIEDSNTESEPEEEVETPADENPTTGAVIALLPIAMAIAAIAALKRR